MKKKLLSFIALFVLSLCAFSLVACGGGNGNGNGDDGVIPPDTTVIADYEFTENQTGYTITKYNGTDEGIILPSEYESSPVTAVGENAFKDNSTLKRVTIPASIKEFGKNAFKGCTAIQVTNYLGTIDEWVTITFKGQYSNPINYSRNLCLDGQPFTSTENITAENISAYSLIGCTTITEINFSESVKSIGNAAFANCTKVTKITVPNTVKTIGISAFFYNIKLESITLPFIGQTADPASYPFGWVFGASYGSNNKDYVPATLKTVNITGGKTIADKAFYDCKNITTLNLPNDYTSIGNYSFWNCFGLNTFTIPESVTSVNSQAFAGCIHLVQIINKSTSVSTNNLNLYSVIDKLTSEPEDQRFFDVDGYNFYKNSNGKYFLFRYSGTENYLTLPEKINDNGYDIHSYAFYQNKNIYKVVTGNNTVNIEQQAFDGCDNLLSVTIGSAVKYISSSAFSSCYHIVELVNKGFNVEGIKKFNYLIKTYNYSAPTEETLIRQGDYFFYKNGNAYYLVNYVGTETDLVCPENIDGNKYSVHKGTFYNNDIIVSIDLGDGVVALGKSAISDCNNLEQITIGVNVTLIETHALSYNNKLTKIILEDKEGWYTRDKGYDKIITAEELSTPEKVCTAFTSTYDDYEYGIKKAVTAQ